MSETILEEAERIVNGARRDHYGHPSENHGCTAELWGAYLTRKTGHRISVDAEDVCVLNILQKMSRHAHARTRDNWVDTVGYARNAEMIGEV